MKEIIHTKSFSLQGKEIACFRLCNTSGSYVEVINYGATLVSIVVPDKEGIKDNVILRYENIRDYLSDIFYLGATIGRFANRISNAGIELNGQLYKLEENDGSNTNHGGFEGFNRKFFDYRIENDSLVLYIKSKDGEGGYPGNLEFSVTYSFNDQNELTIEYHAVSDKETVFNPTNHAYFDLSAGSGNPLDQELRVFAEQSLEMNDAFLPTGRIFPVAETAFDFREYRKISEMMPLKKEILKGYNAYFIGKKTKPGILRLLASLKDSFSGRKVEVYSDMPGIQFYTGDYLTNPFHPFAGVCLEAQFYPDAPNQVHFPSCVLEPGKNVNYVIQYKMI